MRKCIIIFLGLLAGVVASAKEEMVSKSYDANSVRLISIENRYGEIKVETWDKPTITVDAVVSVVSNKEETVDNIIKNVRVGFSQEEDVLHIKTEFGNFFSFMKMSNDLFRGGGFSINYVVKAPKNTELKLDLKSGNIILYERSGNVSINQTDGYLSTQALRGDVTFTLRGCHVKAESIANLHLDMKSGSFELQNGNTIISDTYNCDMIIYSVDMFQGKSLKDKILIKEANTVIVNGSITQVNIEKLKDLGEITADYGAVSIGSIIKGFNELKLTGRGTNLLVNIGKTPANVAISHHQSTKMNVPDDLGLRMKFGETQKDFITTGTVGNPERTSQLLVNCRGGSLTLQ